MPEGVNALCLLVAGVLQATVAGREFTLAWTHSVERVRWEERYRIEDDRLQLVEARVRGHGAGMEPPPGARLQDGTWTWVPGTVVPELQLARSTATTDYTLCAGGRCRTLGEWLTLPPDGGSVTLRACDAGAPVSDADRPPSRASR